MNLFKKFILIVFFILIAQQAQAKLWTVDSNTSNAADFHTAQEAIDAAQAGDTLYFAGSSISYGNATINKQLTLIGPGYYLGDNDILTANKVSAKLDVVGIKREKGYDDSGVMSDLDASGTIIRGFEIGSFYIQGSSSAPLIISNVSIIGNQITGGQNSIGWSANIIIQKNIFSRNCSPTFSVYNSSENAIITNNIFLGLVTVASNSSASITNNTFAVYDNLRGHSIYNSTVTNNIVATVFETENTNSIFKNNISAFNIGTENGNQSSVDLDSIFVGGDSPDGKYQIKPGSAAEGAGLNGEDIGAFGGVSPYSLSGLPPIPVVYDFAAPVTVTGANGLPVSFKVKTRN